MAMFQANFASAAGSALMPFLSAEWVAAVQEENMHLRHQLGLLQKSLVSKPDIVQNHPGMKEYHSAQPDQSNGARKHLSLASLLLGSSRQGHSTPETSTPPSSPSSSVGSLPTELVLSRALPHAPPQSRSLVDVQGTQSLPHGFRPPPGLPAPPGLQMQSNLQDSPDLSPPPGLVSPLSTIVDSDATALLSCASENREPQSDQPITISTFTINGVTGARVEWLISDPMRKFRSNCGFPLVSPEFTVAGHRDLRLVFAAGESWTTEHSSTRKGKKKQAKVEELPLHGSLQLKATNGFSANEVTSVSFTVASVRQGVATIEDQLTVQGCELVQDWRAQIEGRCLRVGVELF